MDKFQDILDKYVRKIDDLGNGNFGLREGFLVPFLYIRTPFPHSGELLIRNSKFGECWDCLRTAYRIGKELENDGFKVKYKAKRTDESVQNYVEVKNPETGEWIQIDATPWYRKLNTGHKATAEHPKLTQDDIEKVKISKLQGQMLSVEELADNLFVETYLAGGYTTALERAAACKDSLVRHYKETCSIYLPEKEREKKQRLIDHLENLNAGQFLESLKDSETVLWYDMELPQFHKTRYEFYKLPEYTLRLWSRLCKSPTDKTLAKASLKIDIMNTENLAPFKLRLKEEFGKNGEYLAYSEEILQSLQDGLAINVEADLWGFCWKNYPIKQIIRGNDRYQEAVIRNLKRNYDCLVNLLLNCQPSITTTDGRQIVYVKSGGVDSVPGRH